MAECEFLSADASPPYSLSVLCPLCKHINTHLEGDPILLRGWEEEHQKPLLDLTAGATRQGGVRIPFWCECGHRFAIEFAEHKGFVYVGFLRSVYAPLDPTATKAGR